MSSASPSPSPSPSPSSSSSFLFPLVEGVISDMESDPEVPIIRRNSPPRYPEMERERDQQRHRTTPTNTQRSTPVATNRTTPVPTRGHSPTHEHSSDAEQEGDHHHHQADSHSHSHPAPIPIREPISIPVLPANIMNSTGPGKFNKLQPRSSTVRVAPTHQHAYAAHPRWTAPPSLFPTVHYHRHTITSPRVTVSSRSCVVIWAIVLSTLLLVGVLWRALLFAQAPATSTSPLSNFNQPGAIVNPVLSVDLASDPVQARFLALSQSHEMDTDVHVGGGGDAHQHAAQTQARDPYTKVYVSAESHRRVLAAMKKEMVDAEQAQQAQRQALQQHQQQQQTQQQPQQIQWQQQQQQWRPQQQQQQQQQQHHLVQRPRAATDQQVRPAQTQYSRYGAYGRQNGYGQQRPRTYDQTSAGYVRTSPYPLMDTAWATVSEKAGTPESIAADSNGAPIDVVYTWVNGSDPDWQAKQAQYGDRSDIANKYREWDELRYSMRSVAMYAPWVRNIILVTADQVPSWLNTSDPRIRIINHRDLFPNPDASLPTFNSLAIESVLHLIPGLSEDFIYMNNDVFLGRPLARGQFGNATHYYRYVDYGMQMKSYCWRAIFQDSESEATMTRSVQSCADDQFYWQQMLSHYYFGARITHWFAHMPHQWNRQVIQDMEHKMGQWFEKARNNRFRNPASDISTHIQFESALTQLAESRSPTPRYTNQYNPYGYPRRNPYGYGGGYGRNTPPPQKSWWFGGDSSSSSSSASAATLPPSRTATASLRPSLKTVEDVIVSDLSDYDHHHLYQYYVFMNHDTHEYYYEKLTERFSYYQPLFIAIDDDLKNPTPEQVTFHRKHFTLFMEQHWPTIPSWELQPQP